MMSRLRTWKSLAATLMLLLLSGQRQGGWGVLAQFPPEPTGITTIRSKLHPGVKLSYKETYICETTPGVRSYAGYIHLPRDDLLDIEGEPEYHMNMFFWFFEARNSPETAPLSMWFGGGPGEASTSGATTENGPCYVLPDGNSTALNPWSRNNHVNMLYIDQPVDAGYSYTRRVNGTVDQLTEAYTPHKFKTEQDVLETVNVTTFVGTFSDQSTRRTLNTSASAAKAVWDFAQIWFEEFPQYNQESISLWTNSYGGYFGPAFFYYFEKQNKLIESGELSNAKVLQLDTLGIENGCIDSIAQASYYITYAFNNTYGLELINKTVHDELLAQYHAPGGCNDLGLQCRAAHVAGDPQGHGNNATVNAICLNATELCLPLLSLPEIFADRSAFDIATILPDPFPFEYNNAFFNTRWVQEALGARVNWTDGSDVVVETFFAGTGDEIWENGIDELEYLLANGVKVALVYGDRDSRCNWLGAENVSLHLDYAGAKHFRASGYENITTNASYVGGVVRQYNNKLSFSRVFQAGHTVSASQPETDYQIFMRAMFNEDVATGTVSTNSRSSYSSEGPSSSFQIKNVLPPSPPVLCYVWGITITCTANQIAALAAGTALVKDYIVVSPAS